MSLKDKYIWRIEMWFINWLDIIDKLVFICSLTVYHTSLGMKARFWQMKRLIKRGKGV